MGAARLGLYLWILCHATGCGHVPPAPPPPPAGCDVACANLQRLKCSTSLALCERICDSAAINQPAFPSCVAASTSCRDADACR